MAEQEKRRSTRLFSRIFRIQEWLDVTRLQGFMAYIVALFKRLFVPQPKAATESFAAAKKRLNLTDAMLLSRQKALFRMSLLMLVIAGLLFAYSIYQIMHGGILGVLLSLIVTLIALALAFRYHFWYFQIKSKQLGCSWQTWFKQGLLGGSK